MNMNVEGKRVLVCGMARSGIAAAKLLMQPWRACDHHGYQAGRRIRRRAG